MKWIGKALYLAMKFDLAVMALIYLSHLCLKKHLKQGTRDKWQAEV